MLIRRDFASRGGLCGSIDCLIKNRKIRLYVISIGFVFCSLSILFRLSSLQIEHSGKWHSSADKQHFKSFMMASSRGPILDSEGRLLSVSVPAGSVFVRPHQIKTAKEKNEVINSLQVKLNLKKEDLEQKLLDPSPFVWIARQIPRQKAEEIRAMKLPGIDFVIESRRYYPFGDAASSLIGKVGIDGNGLTGLEKIYDQTLKSREAKSDYSRDGIGNMIEAVPAVSVDRIDEVEPDGLMLTIDAYVQKIVDEELEAGRIKAKALRAMAVLVDAGSGDIVAMGQAPNVDFNKRHFEDLSSLKNIIAETIYEPGSTIKPIVAAAALDAGVVGPKESIDCENGSFFFAKHFIKDVHPVSIVSFKDVIVRSSNIGMSKIGARLGAESLFTYLKAFGFGESTGLGVPGETKGILRNFNSWAKIDVATHSFGQGIAVTPLQMVRAISAIANNGMLPELRVVRSDEDLKFKRVVSAKAAKLAQEFMYGVVEDEKGTGHNAMLSGVRVGGKTGTAQKAKKDGRGYEPRSYVASFVGFVDGSSLGVDKTLSLIVIIDEPKTDTIYGGTLAAPVFQRIMQRTLSYFGMSHELRRGTDPGYIIAAKKERILNVRGPDLVDAKAEYDPGKS